MIRYWTLSFIIYRVSLSSLPFRKNILKNDKVQFLNLKSERESDNVNLKKIIYLFDIIKKGSSRLYRMNISTGGRACMNKSNGKNIKSKTLSLK